MNEHVSLVAILGGQPQIITFTLDLLLARGEPIEQVVIVYMAGQQRYKNAYTHLAGEFTSDKYAGRTIHLLPIPIRQGKDLIADPENPGQVEAVRATFFSVLEKLKEEGKRIHLSLSGGRRIMALTALAAAMQHLDHADRIWHIYTPPELCEKVQDGRCMHVEPEEGVHLIEVPFVPWTSYFPGLRPLLDRDPVNLLRLADRWLDEQEKDRCRRTWNELTRRQQQVLNELANGLSHEQAAHKLGIAVSTIQSHQKAILEQCVNCWDDDCMRFDLQFIRQHFGPYLMLTDSV